jgi:uncharacterized membrane protein
MTQLSKQSKTNKEVIKNDTLPGIFGSIIWISTFIILFVIIIVIILFVVFAKHIFKRKA